MGEIELKEIIGYYLKKIPLIILTTILMILIGYLYIEYYQVPMYYGKTTIILIQKNETTNSNNILNETENQLNVNEKLVATYSEIIKSRRVLEQVINNLSLDETYEELEENVSVSDVSDTSIIEITVSNKNNEQATLIANEIASVFKIEIIKIYNLENVSVIDEAIIEDDPYNVNIPKQLAVWGVIGIVISCVFIFIIYYFDNTIKSKKEIETRLNLPVLGEVPLAEKLLKKENQKVLIKRISTKEKEQAKTIKKSKIKVETKKTSKPEEERKSAPKSKSKNTTKKKATTKKKTTTSNAKKVNKEGSK